MYPLTIFLFRMFSNAFERFVPTTVDRTSIDPLLVPPTNIPVMTTQQTLLVPDDPNPSNALLPLARACVETEIPFISYWLYPQWTSVFLQQRRFREYIEGLRIHQPYLRTLNIVAYGRGGDLALWAIRKGLFFGFTVRLVTIGTAYRHSVNITHKPRVLHLCITCAHDDSPTSPRALRAVQEFLTAA